MTIELAQPGERFSGGVRLCRPWEGEAPAPPEVLQLNWSLLRSARDPAGRLVQLLDLPEWRPAGGAGSIGETAFAESPPMWADDALAAGGHESIDFGVAGAERRYAGTGRTGAVRWEVSPRLGRLRGLLTLLRSARPGPPAFHEYLLRLNRNLRFAGVGYAEGGIALQAVLIDGDRRWLRLAQDALGTISEMLHLQLTWWKQPPEVLEQLFADAGL